LLYLFLRADAADDHVFNFFLNPFCVLFHDCHALCAAALLIPPSPLCLSLSPLCFLLVLGVLRSLLALVDDAMTMRAALQLRRPLLLAPPPPLPWLYIINVQI
jgi:hypothetical protein